jgi:hypothetical protein
MGNKSPRLPVSSHAAYSMGLLQVWPNYQETEPLSCIHILDASTRVSHERCIDRGVHFGTVIA